MQKFKRTRRPLIDWQARKASIETLRTCYQLSDDLQDKMDELDAQADRQRKIGRCLNDVELYAPGHPLRLAAERRLAVLYSRRHDVLCRVKLELRKAGRRAGHELLVGLAPSIDMLLIVIANIAAVMFLFWLLSFI